MEEELIMARENLIQELGRLSEFAGFNKIMGQVYGLLFLSSEPVSLGDIAGQLGISKGNASLNMKTMERWGLIHPVSKKGDRRDYYEAETDFWKIAQDIINERDKKEIDRTIQAIANIHGSLQDLKPDDSDTDRQFYNSRLASMLEFGTAITQMIQAFIQMGNVRNKQTTQLGTVKEPVRRIHITD